MDAVDHDADFARVEFEDFEGLISQVSHVLELVAFIARRLGSAVALVVLV